MALDSKKSAKLSKLVSQRRICCGGAQRNDGNPWVITGALPGEPLNDLQPVWQRARARARITDVRIKDLRQTFASTAWRRAEPTAILGIIASHPCPFRLIAKHREATV